MVGPDHPRYCGNCGSLVQAGDRFCGVCGASITEAAPTAAPTREIPTQVDPPPPVSSGRRFSIPWWVVGVGSLVILVFGIGIVAVTASGEETIEPLPGVSVEVPEGWVFSPGSDQSGRIENSVGQLLTLIPEEYSTSEDPSGEADASINLREAGTGECDPQSTQVESQPLPPERSTVLGGYDDFLTAAGSMANGEITVDGHTTPWNLMYQSIASPWVSADGSTASEYPDYSSGSFLQVCIEDTNLVVEYAVSSALFGPSRENTEGQPTADRNATIPEAREEIHQEIRERYEDHFGSMTSFLESIETGSWVGRTDLGNIPTALDSYDDVLDDPFDGQLEEIAGSSQGSEEPTPSSSDQQDFEDSEEELLEEFGRDYHQASAAEDWETTYSMLSEDSQQQFTEEEWAEKQQIQRDNQGPVPPLDSVTVEPNEEVSDSPATVTLHYVDGTEENIMAMVPMVVEDPSDSGVPKRYLTEEEISDLEQLAASGSTSGSTVPSIDNSEAGAEEAAEEYYQAAGIEDWTYTYEHLDSETQSMFTEEEWAQKNQWLADNGSVIYHIDSVDRVGTSSEYLRVTLTLTYEDGSSSLRTTYFVLEDGEWLHRFSQEEIDLFMPGVPFEEFVEANGGA